MAEARLRISSRNYSSWSLRGWLLARMSGLDFAVEQVSPDDIEVRAELLLQSSSIRIPCLFHGEVTVWDTLAIAEYLNEIRPEARMLPEERAARATCRAISGEMHSGFEALRSSLPMNLRAHRPGFTLWSGPRADIERITAVWHDCLARRGGPWLFGERPSVADAMYAPVVTRLLTYDVQLDAVAAGYCATIMAWPDMAEWVAAAKAEPEETIAELEIEAEF
ncbi:MAG TPA: glutathione S-transferase [Crenalkalicoccus sp.]|jgi:glutathione S-transferase|nr:glutathione S-transferase [Crenalkalicoccus sp.]